MTLKHCLIKWLKGMKHIPDLTYYITDIVIPHTQFSGNSSYQEIYKIISEDVFSLSCLVGWVHCFIEYNGSSYGVTFENLRTKESIWLNSWDKYDLKEVRTRLFSIFD
jgi:hypothetical protein